MHVGIVTFDFPPSYRRADVAPRPTALGGPLALLLESRGVQVSAPLVDLAARDPGASGGIRDAADLRYCVDALRAAGVECLVIDVYHWARISLVAALVDRLDVPVALYTNTGAGWNGVPCAGAICGSLREFPRTRRAALVEAFLDRDADSLMSWIAGVSALSRMRASRVMLWGGSYGADMPYTRSDPAGIEALLLGEVMTEQEEVLVQRGARIVERDHGRVERFYAWLAANGASVQSDGRMVTDGSLDFQASLYLAARDRLMELEGEHGPGAVGGIAGAAIKCHYEMSIDCQGCTACLLPAFLPFAEDSEGPRAVVPFACEGDLNGLATLTLLHALRPMVPPLFGDLVSFREDHVLLRNCGASSVYWAARSMDPRRSLPLVTLMPNLHGKSGAAVRYETPGGGPVTFARLFRQEGRFAMILGEGTILAEASNSAYDDPWPHTRLALGVDSLLLFRALPCNHGSLTEGRLAGEIEVACAYAGLPVYRCDEESGLRELLRSRGTGGVVQW